MLSVVRPILSAVLFGEGLAIHQRLLLAIHIAQIWRLQGAHSDTWDVRGRMQPQATKSFVS